MTYPPKKKHWKPGTPQVGVFVRTPAGGTIEYVSDHATEDTALFAYVIVAGIYKLPAELVADVRKAYEALVKRTEQEDIEASKRKPRKK